MSDTLAIPVSERLLAVYAVATAQPLDDSASHSSGGVAVDIVPVEAAPLPPAGLLRAMGGSAAALAKLGAATQAVLVRSVGSPGFPPASELTAYAAAQTIADVYDGVLIDTVIPRIVEAPRGVEDLFRLSDWVVLPHSPEADRLWFTTKGMARFGVPELQSRGVPEQAGRAWGAVLTGVSQVLLTQVRDALAARPSPAFVELPSRLRVRLRDIAAGYSDRSRSTDDPALDVAAEIGLAWDPAPHEGADSLLTVQPPDGTGTATDEWVSDVVRALFGSAGPR